MLIHDLQSGCPPCATGILPEVHWIAGAVAIVLIIAAVILYLFPDKTAELFAWTIHPTMSALIMGAGYAAGAYYFIRVFLSPKWHRVGTSFPQSQSLLWCLASRQSSIGTNSIMALLRSTPGSSSTLPLHSSFRSVAANRRTDPGTPDPVDVIVSKPVRVAVGVAGLVLLSVVAIMILFPDVAIGVWPWTLTPAVCLSIGGWLSAPGVCYVLFVFEPRWSAWRIILQHHLLAVSLILLAAVRAWSEFDTSSPATWFFVGGMAAFWIAIAALLFVMDSQRAKVEDRRPV